MNAQQEAAFAALEEVKTVAQERTLAAWALTQRDRALADAIRKAYLVPGVSLARIADASGLSRSRIHQIVNGTR